MQQTETATWSYATGTPDFDCSCLCVYAYMHCSSCRSAFELAAQSVEAAAQVIKRAIDEQQYEEGIRLLNLHIQAQLECQGENDADVPPPATIQLCPRVAAQQLRLYESLGYEEDYNALCLRLVEATVLHASKRKLGARGSRLSAAATGRKGRRTAAVAQEHEEDDDEDDEEEGLSEEDDDADDDDDDADDDDVVEHDEDAEIEKGAANVDEDAIDSEADNDDEDEEEDEEEADDGVGDSLLNFGVARRNRSGSEKPHPVNEIGPPTLEELERPLWNESLFDIIGEEAFTRLLLRVGAPSLDLDHGE